MTQTKIRTITKVPRITITPKISTGLALGVACLVALPASAQVDQVVTPPPNLVLSNYYGVPVGPFGGLEGAAYVARVGDPSAAWFNPAGLARQNAAQISGSAGVYQRTSITPASLPNRGGSFQQLPNFVGFTFSPQPDLTVGAALVTTNAWNQETDSELISPVSGASSGLPIPRTRTSSNATWRSVPVTTQADPGALEVVWRFRS